MQLLSKIIRFWTIRIGLERDFDFCFKTPARIKILSLYTLQNRPFVHQVSVYVTFREHQQFVNLDPIRNDRNHPQD